jgi:hypothetical protein
LYAIPLALPIAIILIRQQRGYYTIRFRKYFQFQYTINCALVLIAFISAVAIQDTPIKVCFCKG